MRSLSPCTIINQIWLDDANSSVNKIECGIPWVETRVHLLGRWWGELQQLCMTLYNFVTYVECLDLVDNTTSCVFLLFPHLFFPIYWTYRTLINLSQLNLKLTWNARENNFKKHMLWGHRPGPNVFVMIDFYNWLV